MGGPTPGAPRAADPTPSEGDGDRVDSTLVDAMLRLTPAERLRLNDRMVRTIRELRHAFRRAAAGR